MKTKRNILITCVLVIGLLIVIFSTNRDYKVLETKYGFYIKNKSKKQLIFIYEINGLEMYTKKTEFLLPGESYQVLKVDFLDTITKIKVVGHISKDDLK